MAVWINEIHYDNSSGDTQEGVEIAGTAGTDLTGWTIVPYNGSGGANYTPIGTLSGTIPNQQNGFGTVYVSIVGLQNGAPDGLALVDNTGTVIQFLSYEGSFVATAGPANGMTSVDIGVSQGGTQSDAFTLQLQGSGNKYSDFTWGAGIAATRGGVNTGQTFVAPAQSLSIADASVTEGNAGTTQISFTVTRANGTTGAVAATWTATFSGGANDANASDFEPGETFTGTVSFADGETSKTIVLDVQGDTAIEPTETFTVTLSAPTGGAVLGDASAVGTITNDDSPPAVTISNAAIVEGASGVSYLVFTVTLAFPPTGPVTMDYATSNGTATAGSDYLAVSGQISFAAGDTVRTISVPIVGDTVPEGNETFTVNLSNLSGASPGVTSATGTITNDDGPLYFALASGSFGEDWTNTGRITTNDNWSGIPHIVGYLGDIDSGSTTGVDPRTRTAPDLGAVDVIAQASTATTDGGVGEFELANPTIGLQGSGTADAPSIVLFMDSSGRSDVRLTATLRDIDGTADNAVQQVNVQYRTDPNGAWINVPGGYFADVTTGGSDTQTTLLDVVLPAGANNAATLQIRIMTTNAAGSDEWVGIDDIVVSSSQSAPSYSIADSAAFEGTGAAPTPISFTVTRSGDASAAGTVGYAVTFPGGGFSASADDFASALTGTVSFDPGETSKTIVLQIAADANPEADEAFTVTLSNPSAGTIADASAVGTIVNDDGAPPFVAVADIVQDEGNSGTTIFTFTVTRTGGMGAFTVAYSTVAGTATDGSDFTGTSGVLSFEAGELSKQVQVSVNGDTAGELAETFQLVLSDPTGFAVLADPAATATIQNDDLLFIHQIQGSAYYSPILAAEGKNSFNVASLTKVVVQAVVTAVDNDGTRQGFYITEETGHWDADWLTSEGIFVMTRDDFNNGTAVSGVNVGDLVTVSAYVMEYQAFSNIPKTVLVSPSTIVNSTANSLPVLVLDGSRPIPNSIMTLVTPDFTSATGATFDATRYALSFWETVEGMLVTIPDMVVADGFITTVGGQPVFQAYSRVHADADQINSRGGYTIAGDPPNSPPDTADADDDTIAGGRHLHDGDVNPDIIEIDFSGFAIDAPEGLAQTATMGDSLGDVTGIVEFDFADRKIYVTNINPAAVTNGVPERETTALGSDPRSLTIATFNVENLDPGDGAARFAALADAIANNLKAPDIILIEEIQDNNGATNDGTTDASVTWQMLVDALNAATGKNYQWVDQEPVNGQEGGQGGGNIRVGFIYNTDRVQLGDLPADAPLADRRKYTDRIGDGLRDAGDLIAFSDDMVAGAINTADWSSTRLSLLGQFTFAGNTIFVTANHFTAKGGSDDFWEIGQSIENGLPENAGWAKRVEQANDVYTMLDLIQSTSAAAKVVAGGDLNDFYFYRPVEVITGYTLPDGTARTGGSRFDLLTLKLSEAERYTYTFDGRSQAIDHILASGSLGAVATYDVVHINTGYNALGTGADASPRLSDHDPAVASFDFRSLSEVLAGTAAAETIEGFGGDDRLTGGDGADTIDGGDGNDTVDYSREIGGGDVIVNLSSDQVFHGVQPGHARDSYGNDDTLISIENVVTGAGNDKVLGSTGANRIETGAGNDYIDGNGGTDTMIGGGGGDVYVVDSTDDIVTELAGGDSADEVRTGLSVYTLPDQVENLVYTGIAPVRFTGNSVDNRMTGTPFADFFLLQQGGVDNVSGLAGNDIFFFGAALTADDVVDGGADYDTVAIQGDYGFGLVLTANVTGIEAISLLSGANTRFGDTADNRYDYDITVDDANFDGGMVKINGGNLLAGEDFTFNGAGEDDARFLIYGGFGEENLTGGQQSDIFFFDGGTFQQGDVVDGSGGYDGLFLRGNYNIDFNDPAWGTPFTNMENITVTSVADTRYASTGEGPYSYTIVFADALLGAGQTLTVNGALLQPGEPLHFDGSLEQQGNFRIFGGGCDDVLRGGGGNDLIYGDGGQDTMSGGGGNDVFRYDLAEESTSSATDAILGFEHDADKIDLSRIDANSLASGDQGFTFISTTPFSGAGSSSAGELRAFQVSPATNLWQVEGDTDGDGNADFVLEVYVDAFQNLTASDFFL